MSEQPQDIYDASGKTIGRVRRVHLGRGQNEFWEARALDGCDLGAHRHRIDAEEAIQDDWEAGRPRDAETPAERWRPIYSRQPPVYLGN